MGLSTLPEGSDFRLLGLDISTNVSWERYISGIAKSTSMRVGCLYRAQKFLPPDATLYLYKTTIRPWTTVVTFGLEVLPVIYLYYIECRSVLLILLVKSWDHRYNLFLTVDL